MYAPMHPRALCAHKCARNVKWQVFAADMFGYIYVLISISFNSPATNVFFLFVALSFVVLAILIARDMKGRPMASGSNPEYD